MGRIGRSWPLVKQSFQILRGDKELMLLPVFSAIWCLLVTAVLLVGGVLRTAAVLSVVQIPSQTTAAVIDRGYHGIFNFGSAVGWVKGR